jgi:hypothetical protein
LQLIAFTHGLPGVGIAVGHAGQVPRQISVTTIRPHSTTSEVPQGWS